jgi:sodium transport system permease protein
MLLMPMMIVMLPGVDSNAWTAFVPLVNLTLLTKAIFLNEARADTIFLTLLASLLYASLAIVFAARTFGREQILLGGRTSLVSLLLPEKRPGIGPTPSLAFTLFALVLVLGYYGSLLLTESGIVTVVLTTQLAFFLLPVIALVAWMKFSRRSAFITRAAGWVACGSAHRRDGWAAVGTGDAAFAGFAGEGDGKNRDAGGRERPL